jgi:hypothetical protein
MAAMSEYPTQGALVRGDPVTIPVNMTVDGVPQDMSTFQWRAQIRSQFDGTLITEFATSVIVPDGGTVASTVLLELTDDKARLIEQGQVFDVEQLDSTGVDTIRTWWICTKLNVQKDVSYDETLTTLKVPLLTKAMR